MTKYHKINTLFKRDMDAPGKPIIEGDFCDPVYEYLANNDWEFTEKIDGMNIRIEYEPDGKHAFAGRTDKALIPTQLYEELYRLFPPGSLHQKFWDAPATLYGEGYGPGIQKGGCYRGTQGFILFDVKIGQWWLTSEGVTTIAKELGVDRVPVIGRGSLFDAIDTVKMRYNFRSVVGCCPAEGIVARPIHELKKRNGERIIAKIKGRDFA